MQHTINAHVLKGKNDIELALCTALLAKSIWIRYIWKFCC